MKKLVEVWNLVFNWIGNGKKTLMGIAFLAIGFLWNYLSGSSEALQQIPFVIMLIGALLLVNALFSKLTGKNINPLAFILIFVVIMELGLYLTRDVEIDFTNMVAIWGACFLFVWALNYALLEATGIPELVKRVVIAFFETLVGAAAIAVAFGIPILIAAVG
jgi:hypothetical protein